MPFISSRCKRSLEQITCTNYVKGFSILFSNWDCGLTKLTKKYQIQCDLWSSSNTDSFTCQFMVFLRNENEWENANINQRIQKKNTNTFKCNHYYVLNWIECHLFSLPLFDQTTISMCGHLLYCWWFQPYREIIIAFHFLPSKYPNRFSWFKLFKNRTKQKIETPKWDFNTQ